MSKKISAKTLADVSCKIIKKRDIGNMMKMVHPSTIFICQVLLTQNLQGHGTTDIHVRRGKVHTAYIKPVLKFLFMNRFILQPLLCVKCKGTRKQKDALYAAMGMSSMIESMCFNKASAIYKSGFIDIIDLFQNGSAGTDLMRNGGSIYE